MGCRLKDFTLAGTWSSETVLGHQVEAVLAMTKPLTYRGKVLFEARPVVLYKVDGKFKGAYQNGDVELSLSFVREELEKQYGPKGLLS